jgi:hypothetical protein
MPARFGPRWTWRIWMTTVGGWRGLLITDSSIVPQPVCFISGIDKPTMDYARAIIARTQEIEGVSFDFRDWKPVDWGNRLKDHVLFPMESAGRMEYERTEDCGHAARYLWRPRPPFLIGFESYTQEGFYEFLNERRQPDVRMVKDSTRPFEEFSGV